MKKGFRIAGGVIAVLAALYVYPFYAPLPVRTTETIVPPFPAEYGEAAIADLEAAETLYREDAYQAAFDLWKPLADAGNPEAQFRIGGLYYRGKYLEENAAEAESWWRKSAVQDHALSYASLSALRHQEVEDQCDDVFLELNKKAAELGYHLSQYREGGYNMRYDNCYGFNSHVALYWVSRAARQGNSSAGAMFALMIQEKFINTASAENMYFYFLIGSHDKDGFWPFIYYSILHFTKDFDLEKINQEYINWHPRLEIRLP